MEGKEGKEGEEGKEGKKGKKGNEGKEQNKGKLKEGTHKSNQATGCYFVDVCVRALTV